MLLAKLPRRCSPNFLAQRSASASTSPRLVALFGDIHFQEKGLPQIERTAKWLIDEVEARRARAAVCLGDVLNTRDTVSVQAQSSALKFFSDMRERLEPQVPIHVILGNHDMALKHSRRISSLDGLAMSARYSSNNLFVHKELTETTLLGEPALFIPYYHDPSEIETYLENYVARVGLSVASQTIVFGHLAIGGALQNIRGTQYKGGLSVTKFLSFKKTFSGHFHIHQSLGKDESLVYVGSPMQFNFGDSNQSRGLLLYDLDRNSYELIENPFGRLYLVLNNNDMELNGEHEVGGKHVRIKSTSLASADAIQRLRSGLLSKGALSVDYQQRLPKIATIPSEERSQSLSKNNSLRKSLEDLVPEYVAESLNPISEEPIDKPTKRKSSMNTSEGVSSPGTKDVEPSTLTQFCVDLIAESKRSLGSVVARSSTFDGSLSKVSICDFMSVSGELNMDLGSMRDGLWLIEGPNGSGKSTLFEAISWCHFGKFLRSEMTANDCVNANAKSCKVTVEYNNGLIIERSRKRGSPDQLKIFQRKGSNEVTYLEDMERGEIKHSQTRLNDLIGIDYETFAQTAVLSGTTVQGFLSGTPMQRRSLVENLMGLEILDAVQIRIQELRQANEKGIEAQSALAESLDIEMKSMKSSEEGLREKVGLTEEAGSVSAELAGLSERLTLALRSTTKAPNGKTRPRETGAIDNDLTKIVSSSEPVTQKVEMLRELIETVVATSTSGLTQELSEALVHIQGANMFRELSIQFALLEYRLNEVRGSLAALTAELEAIQSDLLVKQKKLDEAKAELARLSEQFKMIKFWETAFDKKVRGPKSGFISFRSFVFRDIVGHINQLLGLYSSQLAADYQGGDFSSLDATLNSNLDLVEHYGRRSSGERKRTDLALLLSLFEIARQRSGYHSKYLLLDEVFDALDVSGRGSVQAVLSTLAEMVPKILFISHSDVAVGASLAGTIRTEMARDLNLKPLGTRIRFEEY